MPTRRPLAARLLTDLLRRKGNPRLPLTDTFPLTVNGEMHNVRLRRSERAKRFTLRVKPGTGDIVLTAPAWAGLAEVQDFARRHVGWVAARLATAARRTAFAHDSIVPLRGIPHRIVHRHSARGVVWPETGVDGHPELHVAGDIEHLERRLIDHFKAQARADLLVAVARYTQRLGLPAKRIAVRDQTTRWGSCSASGALSFSWRLILAPPFVLDYLAAHEVAHLKEMNHSARFWRLLADLYPDTERARAWMAANGASLHSYGPAAGLRLDTDDL
jgi:predicted metal-dependent hydrolase